jgi:hypothetical protein
MDGWMLISSWQRCSLQMYHLGTIERDKTIMLRPHKIHSHQKVSRRHVVYDHTSVAYNNTFPNTIKLFIKHVHGM